MSSAPMRSSTGHAVDRMAAAREVGDDRFGDVFGVFDQQNAQPSGPLQPQSEAPSYHIAPGAATASRQLRALGSGQINGTSTFR
jgi:hypothetical protein